MHIMRIFKTDIVCPLGVECVEIGEAPSREFVIQSDSFEVEADEITLSPSVMNTKFMRMI